MYQVFFLLLQGYVFQRVQESLQAVRVAEAEKAESDEGFRASAAASILPMTAAVVVASTGSLPEALQAVGLDDKVTGVVSALGGNVGPTALLTFGIMKLQGLLQENRSKQKALTLALEQLEKAEELVAAVQRSEAQNQKNKLAAAAILLSLIFSGLVVLRP
jgi:hypothetical protein